MPVVKFIFLLIIAFASHLSNAQLLIGPQGGWNLSDIYLGATSIKTEYTGSLNAGLLISYLPENKKPGIKLSFNASSLSFTELGDTYKLKYISNGFDMHFLSHFYLQFNKTRAFIDIGPGISYFSRPEILDQDLSLLPDFIIKNLNKVYLQLSGGAGITQQIGKIDLSVFSMFSFTTTKVFKNESGFSNPLSLRFGASLQFPIFSKPD